MNLEDIEEEVSDEPLFSSEHPAIPSVTVISTSEGDLERDHAQVLTDDEEGELNDRIVKSQVTN
jgi:hypothetical protein